jgi:hypothetical protein
MAWYRDNFTFYLLLSCVDHFKTLYIIGYISTGCLGLYYVSSKSFLVVSIAQNPQIRILIEKFVVARVAKNVPAYYTIHRLITLFIKSHLFKFNYLETVLYVWLLNFIIPITFKRKCMCYTELSFFKRINDIQTPNEISILIITLSD